MLMQLASSATNIVDTIMQYVLIATIALGVIFALIVVIMICKRIRYSLQMKHNKKEIEKVFNQNKQPWMLFCFLFYKLSKNILTQTKTTNSNKNDPTTKFK